MPTTYRPYEPNQPLLLPPSVSEWLPEDHLAHFINDGVDALDLADRTGEELPEELARRTSRLASIQAAKARLEARQREADRAAGRTPGDDEPGSGKRGHPFKRPLGEPAPEAQENFTDPDSRIMYTANGYQQGYNAQAAVDESLLIVAATLTNIASDATQLLPVLKQTTANVGQLPELLLADAGYASEANFLALETMGQAACIALGREGKTSPRTIDPLTHPATARMQARRQ